MKNKRGRFPITLGLLLITAALCLTAYNVLEDQRADEAAREISAALDIPQVSPTPIIDPADLPPYVLNPDMEMPVETIKGHDYIGKLEVPDIKLNLPVMADWSAAKLKIAPCRYHGSVYAGNLVVMAHNFRRHFSKLNTLQPGALVRFTDVDGNVFEYAVIETELLNPNQAKEMKNGDWDLTLFTCTVGGRSRVTVRCEAQTVPY